MSVLPIRLFGDPVLRERAAEVTDFDDGLRRLADDMLETMRAAMGAGLAGNQVGVLRRIFTWELYADGEPVRHGALVNPEVVTTSTEEQDGEEGCLSFPGLFFPAKRPLRAHIKGVGVDGEPFEEEADGLLARIFLHEIDHLNGILFIDHLARHDYKEAMRRIRAGELEQAAGAQEHQAPPSAVRSDGPAI